MQSCLDVVLPYVGERKQFGKNIGEFQVHLVSCMGRAESSLADK